jgi:hypothetical protein
MNILSNQTAVQVYLRLFLPPWLNPVRVHFHALYWVPVLVRHLLRTSVKPWMIQTTTTTIPSLRRVMLGPKPGGVMKKKPASDSMTNRLNQGKVVEEHGPLFPKQRLVITKAKVWLNTVL